MIDDGSLLNLTTHPGRRLGLTVGAGEPGEGDRVEMRSYQIKSSVRLRNSTALISYLSHLHL